VFLNSCPPNSILYKSSKLDEKKDRSLADKSERKIWKANSGRATSRVAEQPENSIKVVQLTDIHLEPEYTMVRISI